VDAIRHRDREGYLACYRKSDRLAVSGPEGFRLGYSDFARQADQGWPDTYDPSDLEVVWISDGVVYGTYRYRVRYGGREESGLSERLFLKAAEGWRIAVTTAFNSPAGTPPAPQALVGGTLVDGTGASPVPDAVVVLRAGKIDCAGSRKTCALPAGVAVTDASGLWIVPGLVDAHVHFSQTGWADGRPDAVDVRETYPYEKVEADLEAHPERFFSSDICAGVTAVFDVGGYPWTLRLPGRAERDARAPHVSAAGPLLSTIDHWLNLPAERQFIVLKDSEAARQGVAFLSAEGSSAVKVWYIVDKEHSVEASAAAVGAAGENARKAGLPLIVHATGLAEAKEALKAGARFLVHSVGDQPVDEEFLSLVKKNGAIYCPTLTVRAGYLRLRRGVLSHTAPAVDDPNHCVDPTTLARIRATAQVTAPVSEGQVASLESRVAREDKVMAENLRKVRDAGLTIAMGTDAGNPLTLHGPSVYAEMEAMQKAGLTPMEVLVASTRGGSLAMGREKEFGTVEKGKAADLLIIAGDPTADIANLRRLRFVVRGGSLRSVEELAAAIAAPSP
jgi:imidazolonepropionase-like amidohydrolase